MTAAVTFVGGLFLLRLVAGMFATQSAFAAALASELLWDLQVLVVISTTLYIILRRREGDFIALFCVSFALFCSSEALSALSRHYGVPAFHNLSVLFALGMFIYSSLALTAGMADGPRAGVYQRLLLTATAGFMFIGALRTMFELRGGEFNSRRGLATTGVLAVVAAYLGIQLWRAEVKGRGTGTPTPETAPASPVVVAEATKEGS